MDLRTSSINVGRREAFTLSHETVVSRMVSITLSRDLLDTLKHVTDLTPALGQLAPFVLILRIASLKRSAIFDIISNLGSKLS